MATTTEDIRRLLEEGKLVIGKNAVRETLEAGEASRVLIAANAPALERDAFADYGEIAKAEVEVLSVRNDQLGTICRKPFPIAFCAVKK